MNPSDFEPRAKLPLDFVAGQKEWPAVIVAERAPPGGGMVSLDFIGLYISKGAQKEPHLAFRAEAGMKPARNPAILAGPRVS